jgi:TPR repeat protein
VNLFPRMLCSYITLAMFANPVLACTYDTDCSPGSKCFKSNGSIYGACIGGISPGNANDRQPIYAPLDINRTYGNTCTWDTDCGPGSHCMKGNNINGVCLNGNAGQVNAANKINNSNSNDGYFTSKQALGAVVVILGAIILVEVVKGIISGLSSNKNKFESAQQPVTLSAEEKREWGEWYLFGPPEKQDLKRAKEFLSDAASAGDTKAQLDLGIMYREGRGVSANEYEAFRWFQLSADQGNQQAQALVGDYIFLGKGTVKDLPLAFTYYEKAVAQGNSSAASSAGAMLFNGIGVKKDEAAAVEWFKKAAAKNNLWGQYYLGIALLQGRGVIADEPEGGRLIRKAADGSLTEAIYLLGNMYENGIGVEKNEQEAARLYHSAAAKSEKNSMFRLAYLYETGTGVEKNMQTAVDWYKRAADLGVTGAKMKAVILERGL